MRISDWSSDVCSSDLMTAEPPQAATATSHQPLIDPASDENPADESRRSPAHRPELHRSSGIFRSVCIASDPIWTKTETPRYPMLRAPPTFRNSSEALSADSSPSVDHKSLRLHLA